MARMPFAHPDSRASDHAKPTHHRLRSIGWGVVGAVKWGTAGAVALGGGGVLGLAICRYFFGDEVLTVTSSEPVAEAAIMASGIGGGCGLLVGTLAGLWYKCDRPN